MHLRRVLGAVFLGAILVQSLAPVVAARQNVDPSTLNPAPPDFFNADCERVGARTLCTLAFSDDPIVDEPSGIICGSTEILFSQTRSVVGKRFYDANGNLTQRHFREYLGGTFVNPDTGRVVLWTQHDTILHNLAVPGDLGTGTTKISGLLTRAWLQGGGTVFTDVGTLLLDSGTDEVIKSGGKHPFQDYFVNGDPTALDALCAALD